MGNARWVWPGLRQTASTIRARELRGDGDRSLDAQKSHQYCWQQVRWIGRYEESRSELGRRGPVFDRETELEILKERVLNGTHTVLTAQRRMGKTSLVRELLRRLADEGRFDTVFVDLEDAASAADAVVEIGCAHATSGVRGRRSVPALPMCCKMSPAGSTRWRYPKCA